MNLENDIMRLIKYFRMMLLALTLLIFGQNVYGQISVQGSEHDNNAAGKENNKKNPFIKKPEPDEMDEYVTPANKKFEEGKWEEGQKIVQEGLKQHPKYSDLWMLSGKYHLHKKDYKKSRYNLHKALEYNSENNEAKKLFVNVETKDKRYSSAIGYVNELLEVHPYLEELWQKKIRLYELQGNQQEANRLRKRLLQIYPDKKEIKDDYIYDLQMQAHQQQKDGNLDKAIKLHKEIIEHQPENIDNYISVINDYLKKGQNQSALDFSERGLKRFPENEDLINKKAGILSDLNRYNELLPFLQDKGLSEQYKYYLEEAGKNARASEPAQLYGKMFAQNPRHKAAFNYVFDDVLSKQQYEEALRLLKRHRKAVGDSKELKLRELNIYQKANNTGQEFPLIKNLFKEYPDDDDIRAQYVKVKTQEAKDNMANEQYQLAIEDWSKVLKYGDDDHKSVAQNSTYNAYVALKDYKKASKILKKTSPFQNEDKLIKEAYLYYKQGYYDKAVNRYEEAVQTSHSDHKEHYLIGYSEMLTKIVKDLNDNYKYDQSLNFVERWLKTDPENKQALQYGFNLANRIDDKKAKEHYAKSGNKAHPNDVFFIIKTTEIQEEKEGDYKKLYDRLFVHLHDRPYHKDLINGFTAITKKYGKQLIQDQDSEIALEKIDTALAYAPQDKSLKYIKGRAYEKLHQYDSAYYYQSFYEPGELEVKEFQHHIKYLNYKSNRNEIIFSHLRNRNGNSNGINSISSIEYNRLNPRSTFNGRINYAGREPGKGVQFLAGWTQLWSNRTATQINAGWANRFFPQLTVDGSIAHYTNLMGGLEFALGGGYRKLEQRKDSIKVGTQDMTNAFIKLNKELQSFSLNFKFDNFILEHDWLYNASLEARYYFSTPKDYIMAIGSVGTSPDVELINFQLYNGFSVLNSMVGLGFQHIVYKNIAVGVLGNWYNYRTNNEDRDYGNLYTLNFNLNVSF